MFYINGRFLCNDINGITRFSLEICKQLKKKGLSFIIVIPNWLDYKNEEDFEIVKFGNLKSHLWEQINLFQFLKRKEDALLLNLSGLGSLFYKKQVITIHDLSFYANKKWFSKAYTLFYSFTTPIVARKAIKIITVSEFSKSEIVKYLNIEPSKIEVVYNGVSNDLRTSENYSNKPLIKGKYILAVSSIDPRKNLQRLIDAFCNLKTDHKLVLVGKSFKHFNIKLSVKSDDVIFTGFVSDEDLKSLYKNCDFFIYPSLYEGFGIPPLEAMKNKCAVIVSKIPSLLEVCGDSALYVDPYDVKSIEDGMLKIIYDSDLKEALKVKGVKRVDLFNWNDSANKISNLIKNINL